MAASQDLTDVPLPSGPGCADWSTLPEPNSHPGDQPAPGPRDRLPADWASQLND